jgi:hypothetical protein
MVNESRVNVTSREPALRILSKQNSDHRTRLSLITTAPPATLGAHPPDTPNHRIMTDRPPVTPFWPPFLRIRAPHEASTLFESVS